MLLVHENLNIAKPSELLNQAWNKPKLHHRAPHVVALINRNLVSQPSERRAMPRIELRCGLYVKWAANLEPATLRNISSRGLQLEGEALPPRGTFVGLFVEGLNISAGEVVWRKDNLAGIELLEELSWTSIIPWIREIGRKEAKSTKG